MPTESTISKFSVRVVKDLHQESEVMGKKERPNPRRTDGIVDRFSEEQNGPHLTVPTRGVRRGNWKHNPDEVCKRWDSLDITGSTLQLRAFELLRTGLVSRSISNEEKQKLLYHCVRFNHEDDLNLMFMLKLIAADDLKKPMDEKGNFPINVVDYPEMVETLVKLGADVDAVPEGSESGNTALFSHARNPKMVKALIDAGADVNKANSNGRTPIYAAISKGSFESIEQLLKNGAKLDVEDASVIRPLETLDGQRLAFINHQILDEVCKYSDINEVYHASDGAFVTLLDYWNESHEAMKEMFADDPRGGADIIEGKAKIVAMLRERGALLYEELPMGRI